MKVTVFTSNQPRHINLINLISEFAEETYAVLECNTLFPGLVPDFYKSSPVMLLTIVDPPVIFGQCMIFYQIMLEQRFTICRRV